MSKSNQVYRMLPYELTDEEREAKEGELTRTKECLKAFNEEHEHIFSQQAALRAAATHLKNVVESGKDFKTMLCKERMNQKKKQIEFVHPTTGKVVGFRPIDESDYQENLLGEENGSAAA